MTLGRFAHFLETTRTLLRTKLPSGRAVIDDSLTADVLDALRRQEEPAFARLVKSHETIITGLCQARGLRGADIDDAAAEVFAAVYRGLPRFRGDSALNTWIYRIAVRVISRIRTRTRSMPQTDFSQGDEPVSPGNSPAEESQQQETSRDLWRAVATLEPRQALAIELFYRRGWGVEQVAEVMECPTGTVKTLLYRAREALKPILARQEIMP